MWYDKLTTQEFEATRAWVESFKKKEENNKCTLCNGKYHTFKYCGTRKRIESICDKEGFHKIWAKIKYSCSEEFAIEKSPIGAENIQLITRLIKLKRKPPNRFRRRY